MIRLRNDTNLLICQKSKIQDWLTHFQTYYPEVILWDLTKPKQLSDFLSRYTAWHGYHGAGVAVGIINYELCWRRSDLKRLNGFTLMLDESSLIQNRKAKQTKFILKLQPANVILLSGTPTAGKYENLWTQIHLLGWDISESAYNAQFVNWKTQKIGWMNPKIIRVVDKDKPYKNVERLKAKMREHGAQFLKTEECFALPEQTFIEVNVSKNPKYDKFMKDCVINVDGVDLVGDTLLTKRLYARQLCGIFSESKIQAFHDLVESTNDRLIVFYNFNAELEHIRHVCEELNRPISVINGHDKDLSAYENESDSVTLIQYQAGAKGLNLQKANKIIYFSPTEKCDDWMQSIKRIHRLGQNRPCFYYKLICKGTIEEDIYSCLERGEDYTDRLFEEGGQAIYDSRT